MRNRHFSLLICIWILSIVLLSQGSCKKDDPDPNPEPEVPKTTKIILSQDWNAYITVIDSNTWTLTAIPELVQKYDLQAGDILICTKGQGLLRKITSIQELNGNLLISTKEGTIVEAMPKGKLDFNIDLTQNLKDAKITYMAEGVQVKNMEKDRQNRIELVFSLEKELDDHLSISGELSIAPSISGRVVWNGQTPGYHKNAIHHKREPGNPFHGGYHVIKSRKGGHTGNHCVADNHHLCWHSCPDHPRIIVETGSKC